MKKRITFKFILLLLCVGYACFVLISQLSVVQEQKTEAAQLEERLKAAQYENSYLQNKLDYINTSEYVEEAARERFGWVKPGERVYEQKELGD